MLWRRAGHSLFADDVFGHRYRTDDVLPPTQSMAAADQEVVLLGLCDGAADPKEHTSSCLNSKIGDQPDVFPGGSRPSTDCPLCGVPLVHVVQVYCPLEGSPYHRTLHLFACTRPACSGRPRAWRVLRSQALETEVLPTGPVPDPPVPLAAATDWCDAADDWGMEDDIGDVPTNELPPQVVEKPPAEQPVLLVPPEAEVHQVPSEVEVSAGLQQLSLRGDAALLRGFYISVVEESELRGGEAGLEHAQRLLREYEEREGTSVGTALEGEENTSGGEKYEKSRARHGDAAFSRFMKRVSLCPEQVLRYSWGGEPLFISDLPSNWAQMVPVCDSCGTRRTFELQLMPALVSLLRPAGPTPDPGVPTPDSAPLEFGTVLVFTCGGSCWTTGSSPREEFVFLQDDPDQQLFI
ncbi:unnamed protein product [Gadus morhua 'NCC']